MKFKRYGRSAFEDTQRKRAAAARRQAQEREAYPLIAEHIANQQPSLDDVMQARATRWQSTEERHRAFHARKWRQGRAQLARFDRAQRAAFLDYWNTHWAGPRTSIYFCSLLHMLDTGRLENALHIAAEKNAGRDPYAEGRAQLERTKGGRS